jgi:hypothetical protein
MYVIDPPHIFYDQHKLLFTLKKSKHNSSFILNVKFFKIGIYIVIEGDYFLLYHVF